MAGRPHGPSAAPRGSAEVAAAPCPFQARGRGSGRAGRRWPRWPQWRRRRRLCLPDLPPQASQVLEKPLGLLNAEVPPRRGGIRPLEERTALAVGSCTLETKISGTVPLSSCQTRRRGLCSLGLPLVLTSCQLRAVRNLWLGGGGLGPSPGAASGSLETADGPSRGWMRARLTAGLSEENLEDLSKLRDQVSPSPLLQV